MMRSVQELFLAFIAMFLLLGAIQANQEVMQDRDDEVRNDDTAELRSEGNFPLNKTELASNCIGMIGIMYRSKIKGGDQNHPKYLWITSLSKNVALACIFRAMPLFLRKSGKV